MRRPLLLPAALICLGTAAAVEAPRVMPSGGAGRLNPPAHSQWGFILVDARSGKTLAENGSRRFLIPASVAKVVTTGFALDKLGPARRFATELFYSGKVEKGILRGDLWIRGGGNPELGSDRADSTQRVETVFALYAQALEHAGIRAITGSVRSDAGLLAPEGPASGDLWEDIGNYYGAAPTGLCFHDNYYTLQLDGAAQKGHALAARGTLPQHAGISQFQVLAQTSDPLSPDSCNILGAFWNTPRLVTGTCPAGREPLEIKGSLPDPGWTLARTFEDYLRARKIAVRDSGGAPRDAEPLPPLPALPADTVRLAAHLSPPLLDIIAVLHGYSDNLYAAQLLAWCGEPPGTAGGLKARRAWLEQIVPGITNELRLLDGNGLSRQDAVTPAALTRLLCAYTRKPWFPAWRETLLGGKICPLKPAAYADGLAGKVWVKTGSMSGAASLTGYLLAKSGRLLAFTILVNHFEESPTAVRNNWGSLLHAWSQRN